MVRANLIASTFLAVIGFSAAHANGVEISVNKPMDITYKIAHKNPNSETVFGSLQSIRVDKQLTIPVQLEGYALAGVVPVTVDGHTLPTTANEFGKPQQCSMATNNVKTSGTLYFETSSHEATCKAGGGVFG